MNGEQQPDRGTEIATPPDPHNAGQANRSWFKQLRHSVRDKLIYLRALPRLASYDLALRDASEIQGFEIEWEEDEGTMDDLDEY